MYRRSVYMTVCIKINVEFCLLESTQKDENRGKFKLKQKMKFTFVPRGTEEMKRETNSI